MGFWDTTKAPFTRDGAATRVFEKIPVVGHITAGVQLLSGNREHAKRALATSTNSLISTGGAVAGFMVAGPPFEQYKNVECQVGDLVNTLANWLDVVTAPGELHQPALDYWNGQKTIYYEKILKNRANIYGKMTKEQEHDFGDYLNAQLYYAIKKLDEKMRDEYAYGWFPDTDP
ncbi:hypothetical protein AX16_008311 [Volvariella volvacea WC 439]|nr:hypothetical protein AX16_008311 [Volvariella volvacea WC 439]